MKQTSKELDKETIANALYAVSNVLKKYGNVFKNRNEERDGYDGILRIEMSDRIKEAAKSLNQLSENMQYNHRRGWIRRNTADRNV